MFLRVGVLPSKLDHHQQSYFPQTGRDWRHLLTDSRFLKPPSVSLKSSFQCPDFVSLKKYCFPFVNRNLSGNTHMFTMLQRIVWATLCWYGMSATCHKFTCDDFAPSSCFSRRYCKSLFLVCWLIPTDITASMSGVWNLAVRFDSSLYFYYYEQICKEGKSDINL